MMDDDNSDTDAPAMASPDPAHSPAPTASGSGDPRSSAGGCSSDKKRRRCRRAKKGGRKRNASGEQPAQGASGSNGSAQFTAPLPSTSRPISASQRFQHRLDQQQLQRRASAASGSGGGPMRKQVCLRPTNGPLLNAPRNSTQFIIDDHEPGDDEFMNFDRRRSSKGSQNNDDDDAQEPSSSSKTPSTDDAEDTSAWDEDFSERDFQTVYESAHREGIAAWDRKRLCDEIASLERRRKELVNVLARVDPELYLEKLQTEVLALQETNRSLRRERASIAPGVVPDSSTKEVASGQIQGEENVE